MNRRIRRRREKPRRRLGALLFPAIIGACSFFIATHYAVDWGKASSPASVVAPEVIARAEQAPTAPVAPDPTPIPSPTTSAATPTRLPSTAQPATPTRPASTGAVGLQSTQDALLRAPFLPDFALAAEVSAHVAGQSGRYGVAIKNLRTGQGVLIDPDGEYEAASLFKLPVMFEVFKQREAGLLSFDEQLLLTDRHVAYDLGTLDRPAGSTIGLDEALERMITFSDNSSAILLTDRVGAFAVNQDLIRWGLPHTRLLLDDLSTSPADMLRFLEMVALGEAVSPRASREMVQLLAQQRVNDRIPSLLPRGTVVAHKTGNLPGVVNDVGIVYAPSGPFVIAVLVDGTTDDAAAARATADIALVAYKRFSGG
jgi:beta-lactamase class A